MLQTNQNYQTRHREFGFLGLLTLLFIGLKLGGVISWSWWLVLAPLWMPVAAFIIMLGVMVFFVALLSR
jgi:hypothetical protein